MIDQSITQLQDVELANLYRTKQNADSGNTNIVNPSKDAYGALIFLFDFLNQRLFNGTLPNCIITMSQGRRAQGHFCEQTWTRANRGDVCDEIALNPLYFHDKSTERVLSTFGHEMVHLQQFHFFKPGKGAYHNKEWGRLMRRVGLIPSSTGREGGAETGRRVSHYIEEGGVFQRVCHELLDTGFVIPWHVIPSSNGQGEGEDNDDMTKKKRASKTKYSCPACELNAWAKPDISIVCGACHLELEAALS